MNETHIESSITEKMRQVRPPNAPAKQAERIGLKTYQEAIRPSDTQSSISVKIDLSKLDKAK